MVATQCYMTQLTRRTVVRLSGVDVRSFLQGIITQDIMLLTPTTPLFAAMLSPQGRFLCDFFIVQDGDEVLLDVDSSAVDELVKKLTLYRLRAKVTIQREASWVVAAVFGGEILPLVGGHGIVFEDVRVPAMGWRVMLPVEQWERLSEASPLYALVNVDVYERHRLSLGVPDGAQDAVVDRSLLLELGYDALHSISFTKGCYVGQEVTARSKHRAQLHKALYVVTSTDGAALPNIGTAILCGDDEVGELRSSCGDVGLALLRIERVEPHLHDDFIAGGVAVRAHVPQWRM
jgi:folate-binding protein YgfZ